MQAWVRSSRFWGVTLLWNMEIISLSERMMRSLFYERGFLHSASMRSGNVWWEWQIPNATAHRRVCKIKGILMIFDFTSSYSNSLVWGFKSSTVMQFRLLLEHSYTFTGWNLALLHLPNFALANSQFNYLVMGFILLYSDARWIIVARWGNI